MDDVIVYGLIDRNRNAVERFLRYFTTQVAETADEYEYPQFSDMPEAVYPTYTSVLDRLETEKHTSYSLYLNVVQPRNKLPIRQLILVYTQDEGLIVGVVTPEPHVNLILEEMLTVFDVRWGMVYGDQPSPDSVRSFQAACRNSGLPCILEGKLLT